MTQAQKIMSAVADTYGFTTEMMLRRDRTRDLAMARFTAWRLMCDAGMTHKQVAEIFGLNQSAIAYGCKITRQWEDRNMGNWMYLYALQDAREALEDGR